MAFLAGLAVAGCGAATTQVATLEPSSAFDPGRYADFAFLPPPKETADPGGEDLTESARQAALELLQAKGYAPVPQAEADLLVVFYTNLDVAADLVPADYTTRGWEEAQVPAATQPETPSGPDTQSRAIQQWQTGYLHDPQGYLDKIVVVDVVDARAGELVWRGWARKPQTVHTVGSAEIVEAVREIMKEFPAR